MLVEGRGKQDVSRGGGASRLQVEGEGHGRVGGAGRMLVEGEGQTSW